MQTKTILLFADPNSIHTEKWIKGYNDLGYQIVLSGIGRDSEVFEDQVIKRFIFSVKLDKSGGNQLIYLKKFLSFFYAKLKSGTKIVNAHYLTSYGLIASVLKRKGEFLIISAHGTDIMVTPFKSRLHMLLSRFSLKRADLIVSVSSAMTKRILEICPECNEKIITQQYGIDIEAFSGLREGDWVNKSIDIISNRAWVKNSNIPLIIEVMKRLPNKKHCLIGYDPTDKIESENYIRLLREKSKGIEVLSKMKHKEMLKKVKDSRIYLSLTDSDGTSLSLLEAMYLGVIPIISDIAPNREWVQNGVNGFLVSKNPNEVVSVIKTVLGWDIEQINLIVEYNRKLIEERANFSANFQKIGKRLIVTEKTL